MKESLRLLVAFVVLTLASCTGVKPTNPQQAVFEIKQNYELALSVGVAYDNLPACTPGVVVCSTPAGKQKVKLAKDAASPAIQSAENAVRDPTFDASTANKVVLSAQAAVIALTAIVATLPHK